jgi:hypothetical protein
MKQCSKCKQIKDLDQFKPDIRRKDGTGSWCKECERVLQSTPKALQSKRARMLWRKFNITLAEYDLMHESQNGCCAICLDHQCNFDRALSVDHDHATNKIRGLLCDPCNLGLGNFKDNMGVLGNAVSYLDQNENQPSQDETIDLFCIDAVTTLNCLKLSRFPSH